MSSALLGVLAAGPTGQRGRALDGLGRGLEVAGRDQGAGLAVDDHLGERAAPERHDGSPAGLRLGGDHPERLLPLRRTEHDGRAGHRLPQRRLRHGGVNGDAGLGAARVDLLPRVVGVVGVAVDRDVHAGQPRDGDRLGGALLGAEPAGEQRARSRGEREGDLPRRDERRQDRVDRARCGATRRPGSPRRRPPPAESCAARPGAARRRPPDRAAGGRYARRPRPASSPDRPRVRRRRGCGRRRSRRRAPGRRPGRRHARRRSSAERPRPQPGRAWPPARGGRRPCRRRRRPAPPTRRRRRARRRGPCRRARARARPRRPASRRAAAPGSG